MLRAGRSGDQIPGRRDFPHPSRPVLGPTQSPIKWVQGQSRGQNRWGVALTTHVQSSAEVKDRVESYIYSTSVPSWRFLRYTSRTCEDITYSEGNAHVVIHLACFRSWVYRFEWKFFCTLCRGRPQLATTCGTHIRTWEMGTAAGQRNWGSDILHNLEVHKSSKNLVAT